MSTIGRSAFSKSHAVPNAAPAPRAPRPTAPPTTSAAPPKMDNGVTPWLRYSCASAGRVPLPYGNEISVFRTRSSRFTTRKSSGAAPYAPAPKPLNHACASGSPANCRWRSITYCSNVISGAAGAKRVGKFPACSASIWYSASRISASRCQSVMLCGSFVNGFTICGVPS